MDEHLANVEREAKAALEQFRSSGMNLSDTFMKYFMKTTYARLKQTCERYTIEAKLKIPSLIMTPEQKTSKSNSTDAEKKKKNSTVVNEPPQKSTDSKSCKMTKRQSDSTDGTQHLKKKRMSTETAQNNTSANASNKHDHGSTKYFCVHCLDQKNFSAKNSFSGTIDDVYDHWLAKHANEAISKPFQFYAVASVGCFHCKDIGTYQELVEHHEAKHSGQQFAVVNRRDSKKCGICHFNDGDLIEHFKEKHDLNDVQLNMSMIFNPIRYSEIRIAKLMKINVHKKRQCKECNGIFDTQDEIAKHFATSHNGQTVQSQEYIHKRCTLAHLMCGYCHKKVDCTKLVNHFREHSHNFCCSKCVYQTDDWSELICHEKIIHNIDSKNDPHWLKLKYFNSDMVFTNGLTLKAYNVLETKFDDSKVFDMFIDGFFELMKEKAMKKIELKMATQSISTASNIPTITPPVQTQPETRSTGAISLPTPVIELNNEEEAAVTPSTSTSQLNSTQIQSSPQIGSAVPIRRPEHIADLFEQRKLPKNVYIAGLSSDLDIKDLYEIFLLFCQKLGISMAREDIEDIVQWHDGIIVKFYQLQTKESFVSGTNGFQVCINDLVYLPEPIALAPWAIYVQEG